jgi:IS5 family transposase
VVLRMLLLKHMRDFSFQELSREVRANLIYRQFTRVGGGKVPDDKTMGRLARQLRPELIKQLHDRFVAIARKENIIRRVIFKIRSDLASQVNRPRGTRVD